MSAQAESLRFSGVSGESLAFEQFDLPGDLEGEVNLVFVAFLMRHQRDVDQWLSGLGDIEARYPGLRVYEVPLMRRFPDFYRRWIDNAMRSGIPDPAIRASTITVYTDRQAFLGAVGLEDTESIFVTLVDRTGLVLWSHNGPITSGAVIGLHRALTSGLAQTTERPQSSESKS